MTTTVNPNKVLVALSGGVDSAAAATLLSQAGLEVSAVFICLQHDSVGQPAGRSCCSPQDAADAAAVAARLGIDFQTLDGNDAMAQIKDDFARAYAEGKTPNPCIACNRLIKFGQLFELADAVGAQYIATGHYANIVESQAGVQLRRAGAIEKDQSYVLFGIERSRLGRIRFPLGALTSKQQARTIVKEAGLVVHDKPDSQEICFVPENDYRLFLQGRADGALRPGPILDRGGNVMGTHNGYGQFTIGQRRGIRIAAAMPLYVIGIDPAQCSITVGPREALACSGLLAAEANWLVDVAESFRCQVQIRYKNRGTSGTVRKFDDGRFEVVFDTPVDAVTPGQAAVLYDGDTVLGGGWIERALPVEAI